MNFRQILGRAALLLAVAASAMAQTSATLTLEQARQTALRNHPRIAAAGYNAQAASAVASETRSAYFPVANANLTTVGALPNSSLAAGALSNSAVYNRNSNGVLVGQLITDFGRTHNLVKGAQLQAQAATVNVQSTRATVLLRVTEAYLSVLRAGALLRVAQATVTDRQVLADQATELAKHKLKSGLDVSFAKVNLEQAKLLLLQAENGVDASRATLAETLGSPLEPGSVLVETPMPPETSSEVKALVEQAMRDRPELEGARLTEQAAEKVAAAKRDLWFPTVSALAAAGYTPIHQHQLTDSYGAAALNISVPIFNGYLFGAERAEAQSRARAESEHLRELQNQIARDVRLAWLNDRSAFERVALTRQLLDQAEMASQLAKARYRLGLASIVEISQAELALTQAQIDRASAQYDYQIADAELQFQLGALR